MTKSVNDGCYWRQKVQVRRRLEEAIRDITENVEELLDFKLVKYLPISMYVYSPIYCLQQGTNYCSVLHILPFHSFFISSMQNYQAQHHRGQERERDSISSETPCNNFGYNMTALTARVI
jgi:hypothetical protein